jgi:hypothetical protein
VPLECQKHQRTLFPKLLKEEEEEEEEIEGAKKE